MIDQKEVGLKEKMQTQLAGFVGLLAFALVVFFIGTGLRLYKAIAQSLGTWSEPPLVDVLVVGYTLFLVAILIGAAVRWLLIYKWVALGNKRDHE